ncbi:MAG TPA: hypothetical protein VMN37_01400 [Gemmatimonadales bacterium]|nr:hypothetical protein [Gemmatimonadales bacterium]
MTVGTARERRETPRPAPGALWFGLLGGIIAWAAGFTVSYPLSAGCSPAAAGAAWGVTAATLLLAGGATVVAWRNWTALRDTAERGAGGWPGRAAFMGFAGMLLSGGAVLLTVAHAIPLLLLDPCVPT